MGSLEQGAWSQAATEVIESVGFSFMKPEEVKSLSFLSVTNPILLDTIGVPVPRGLYDPLLGPLDERTPCKTCGQLSLSCPGHCGHIELFYPVYNPLLFHQLHNILQKTCFHCGYFRSPKKEAEKCVAQLKLIIKGDLVGAKRLASDSDDVSLYAEESDGYDSASTVHSGSQCPCPDDDDEQPQKKQGWTSLQFKEANDVVNKFLKLRSKKCRNCQQSNPNITKPTFGWFHKSGMSDANIRSNTIRGYNGSVDAGDSATKSRSKQFEKAHNEYQKQKSSSSIDLLPIEVKEILKLLWQKESEFCSFIGDLQQRSFDKKVDYSMFFIENLLVPPTKFRAPTKGGDSVMEHPQTAQLTKVLQTNSDLKSARLKEAGQKEIVKKWLALQQTIGVLFDSKTATGQGQKDASNGIIQLLEKKEGVFRQKMMGKRVNYACRSVISPDPYLAVNEIGIPPCFALKLTYPERVTPWNVAELRQAVINGPDIHPGATHYADKHSIVKLLSNQKTRISVSRKLPSSRGTLTKPGHSCEFDFEGKTVYRHLRDGDVVLVNRQPTLHKPSIMAHVVRVLKGQKTIRMHYANCSTYNADFDGDEMNVHFPQDEVARAEGYNIVNANNQYARPSNGDPLRALIQDHIISAVLLSKKDTFLNREDFNQLLFSSGVTELGVASFSGKPGKKVSIISSGDEILSVEPAIWKPEILWSGKQVITAVLNHITKGHPPFTVEKAAKFPQDLFKTRNKETNENIKDTKKVVKGNGDESWKQELLEDKMLIHKNEFVRGVIDKAQFADYGLVHTVHEFYGPSTAGALLSVFSRLFTVYLQMHGFTCGVDDLLIKKDYDDERTKQLQYCDQIGEKVLRKAVGAEVDAKIEPKELKSRFEKTIVSDGEAALLAFDRTVVNELNQGTSQGVMNDLLSDGLLKSTGKNCISLMTISGAKGSKVNFQQISSHLGQQDLEGKRPPRMVSGKTLPCFHPWDWAPRAGGFISDRFLSGLRPQEYYFHCMAGREGLVDTAVKTSRSGYLQRCLIKNLECLKVNYDYTVRDSDNSIIQFQYGEDGVDVHRTSFIGKFKEITLNQDMVLKTIGQETSPDASNDYIVDLPSTLKKQAESFLEKLSLKERMSSYTVNQEGFMKLMKSKFMSCLAQPGEPVGVLAAQSVGEPSTQMTLNTFHLAGRGEMNVTLGIPRLQEILMTASNDIKTPIMTCPLLEGKTKEDAESLTDKMRKITVADIIERMEVSVVPYAIFENQICSIQKLKMKLYVPEHYPKHTDISIEDWEETLQIVFLRELEDAIQNHMVLLSKISGIKNFVSDSRPNDSTETDDDTSVKKSRRGEVDDDDHDDEGDGKDIDDLGGDAQKRKKQTTDEMDYEESDDEAKNEPSSPLSQPDGTTNESDIEDGSDINEDAMDERKSPMNATSPGKNVNSETEVKGTKDKKKMKKTKADFVPKDTDRAVLVNIKGLNFEVHFKFVNEPHILLSQIAQKTAKKVYIQNSGKIEKCQVANCNDGQVIYHGKDPKERLDIKAEVKRELPALNSAGIDFNAFWELQDYLDVRYLYSNSIHAMLNTYGVEAARETIIREINHVFKSYGIAVNIRHLSLIADYMTHTGGYRPMSRLGGIADSTSPFSRMSFETAAKFIVQAATFGEADNMETPSGRICLGLPVKMGTGSFDLLQNFDI